MKKTILYRLFGLGSVPRKLRPVLEQEGMVVFDEGVRGSFVTKHVNGPGKRYRRSGRLSMLDIFSGCEYTNVVKQRLWEIIPVACDQRYACREGQFRERHIV